MNEKRSRSESIEFLSSLRAQDIHVRVEEGTLRCNAPRGALTDELRAELGRRKAEILELLQPSSYSLVEIQPKGTLPPLFGIHSTRYRTLSTYLGTDQPLYALRYGLAQASVAAVALPDRIDELASHYVEEMRRVQPEGPYHLMGLCIGGQIAFEMAHQLLDQGEEVALLALFDALGPDGAMSLPLRDRIRNLLRIGAGPTWRRVRERMRNRVPRGGEDPDPDRSAREKYRHHVPDHIYPGEVHLFRPADRRSLTHQFAHDLGWGSLVTGPLEIHTIPGEDHTAMFREPRVQILAEHMRGCLAAARGRRLMNQSATSAVDAEMHAQ